MSGPLHLVLAEISAGTPTLTEISRRTGLSEDVVRAAVTHLVRAGRVASTELSLGCPTSGCGTCPASSGCALPRTLGVRRPGLVSLTISHTQA